MDEKSWKNAWGGNILFSHGTNLSRGVAILIPDSIEPRLNISNIHTDSEGRMVLLEGEIDDNPVVIINLYAPTKDQENLQLQFLKQVIECLEKYNDKNVIIGGDFNICLNNNLDKRGGKKENASKSSNFLNSLIEEYNLSDIWRIRNPTEQKYTRRENCKTGLVQSRLDYILISTQLSYNISKCDIKPGLKSDHSLVNITLDLVNTEQRGPSYWKFNNTLLLDNTYT